MRPLAPHAFADLGRAVSASSLAAHDAATSHPTALGAWIREVGLVSLAIAAAGAVVALLRGSTRPAVLALLAFVAADTLLPASSTGVLTADPLTSLRALSVAAIAVASALGVREATLRLVRSGVPLARAAAVLVVIFHLTLVALASEEAGFVADRSEQLAAEEWTDEAMAELEPDSAILVRSPALVWRLAAARMLRGERPDVVVIPVPLLGRGRVAADLYARDRRLEPLLRAYALTGEPSEFALSKVADVHPLHVELDPEWTKRLVSHLVVDGMWLEFAPQPLGASDRKQAAAATLAPLKRVLTAVGSGAALDAPTAVVLAGTLRDHAAVLATLGEHETAKTFLARVAELVPEDPAAATVFPLGLGAPSARAKQSARASRRR